jgi:hypothetical protein
MGAPARAAVVTLPFPFSDLSASKLRPAVILAGAGRRNWIGHCSFDECGAHAALIEEFVRHRVVPEIKRRQKL